MAGSDQELESRAVDRLIFFSDAVVAIAITLLAIDLPVPAGHTLRLFWASVQNNEDRYLAFLVSFTAIAAAWSDHHDAFRYTRRMDRRLRALNMGWLLMIVVIPFATKVLTVGSHENPEVHAVRFGFYALV
ncbi:MAG: TMEM175 family protein [Streptosporangiaceae bacterium]